MFATIALRFAKRSSLVFCALVALLLSTPSTHAHQQKEAYITLLFNDKTGNLEISHRFLIHDAEHIFARLFDTKALELSGDLLSDEPTQLAFAAYVETQFALADANTKVLPLESVGYEVDGKHFWVYQETAIPRTDELKIKHSALHELWPSQTNHINVEVAGAISSLRLQKRDSSDWRSIKLPQSKVESDDTE